MLEININGEVTTNHLSPTVNPCVSTTSPRDVYWKTRDQRESIPDDSGDRAHTLVDCEAVEVRTFVCHQQTSPPGGGLGSTHKVLTCSEELVRRVQYVPSGHYHPDAGRV